MDTLIGTAEISIQGERVLNFINYTHDSAVYQVIGFTKPTITIVDYRETGLMAIHDLLNSGDLHEFAPRFNTPAKVSIHIDDEGNVTIELEDPGNDLPHQMLWIVIGIQDSIPIYDYIFEMITPLDDGTFGFVAYFNIPKLDLVDQSLDLLGCEYSK